MTEAAPPAPAVEPAPPVPTSPAALTPPAAEALPTDAPRVTPGPVEPLEIVTSRGPVRFMVEMADTDHEREQGLMWRGALGTDRGMIFDFGDEAKRAFWMRNTYVPLDMIFIRADGTIDSIAQDAAPLSDTPIPSAGPVRAVLEINGGFAEKLGIMPGDRVRHRIFP